MGKPQDYRAILIKSLSTFFFIGYLPVMPGTFGSLAGLGVFWLIKSNGGNLFAVTLLLLILGFFSTGRTQEIFGRKDPGCVVIDEVCGMLISLLFMPYYSVKVVFAAFFYFRLLDTLKPFPAGRIEKMGGRFGVMGDDITAAVYTNIVLQVVLRLASFRVS